MNRQKNLFFACSYGFTKIKAWSKIVWMCMDKTSCDQSGHGTGKLNASQKSKDGITWFFACCYKFKKVKSWFSDFWVGLVKNGHGLLVYETL